MNRYEDQVVAITGAGQGLGRAMAQRVAAEGALVAWAARHGDAVPAGAQGQGRPAALP